jgi:hypothetical protein
MRSSFSAGCRRRCGSTGKRPAELFLAEEKPRIAPLPPMPADCAVETQAVSDNQFRVTVDTNRPFRD